MQMFARIVVAAAALAAMAAGAAGVEKFSADVIVVGAGGTGVAAAAAAAQQGARVIVLEKMPFVGGTSALAGGAIAAGGSKAQKRAGMEGLTAQGFADIWLSDQKRSLPGGCKDYPDEAKVRRMAEQFAPTVDWLESLGHTVATPRPFGYGGPNYAHAPAESPVPASGRGSSAGGGYFTIKNVKAFLDRQKNVSIRLETAADRLILTKKGAVAGVFAHSGDRKLELRAKAVILACGGFPHNHEMVARRIPVYGQYTDRSRAVKGDTGDGIRMALAAGAVEYADSWAMGLFLDSGKPGLSKTFTSKDKYKDRVFINEKGVRFVNENLPYLTDAIAVQKAAWAIVDSADPAKAKTLEGLDDPRTAVKADTWEALAAKMGVPAKALASTMQAYNADCLSGKDRTFDKPAKFLKPFVKAPFHAVRVVPQSAGTLGGIKVNDFCQVLRKDGSVIRGLYAGGEMMNRPYYNRVYTSGTGLGIAYTTGRIAGTHAARSVLGKK